MERRSDEVWLDIKAIAERHVSVHTILAWLGACSAAVTVAMFVSGVGSIQELFPDARGGTGIEIGAPLTDDGADGPRLDNPVVSLLKSPLVFASILYGGLGALILWPFDFLLPLIGVQFGWGAAVWSWVWGTATIDWFWNQSSRAGIVVVWVVWGGLPGAITAVDAIRQRSQEKRKAGRESTIHTEPDDPVAAMRKDLEALRRGLRDVRDNVDVLAGAVGALGEDLAALARNRRSGRTP